MAHNIDMSNARANIAFLGSRQDIWHRLGQEMEAGMSIEDWARAAGLDWQAVKVRAVALLAGSEFDHLEPSTRMREVTGQNFVVRSDNGQPLGYVSDIYQPVQPAEILEWFQQYISVDSRFELDVAGSLKKGEIIWATARFNGDTDVVGEQHKARLLMTTTFDGSGATINKATMTRVVCNNTLDAALIDGKAQVKTRHNTRFNPQRVAQELATIAHGFESYKTMAEAMVGTTMAANDISLFFKGCLDIPFDAQQSDISTRKINQFQALSNAYKTTVLEGTPANTAWSAFNAVTRFVDHDRTTRGGDNPDEARMLSSQFGSGASLKGKALGLLMPDFRSNRELVPIAA